MAGPRRARSSPHQGRAKPRGSAKDRALGLLAVRWRSREEIRRRLRQAGFEDEDVDRAIEDLDRAGLVDDARFARELVRDQAGRRLAGDRAVRAALWEKGVAPEEADRALEAAGDEAARALELASRRAMRLGNAGADTASRRIYGLLLRRGYGPSVARDATRKALADLLGTDLGTGE